MLNIFFHAEKNWLYRTSPDIEYIHRMRKWQDTHANGDEPRADWELCRLLSDVSVWFGLLDEFVLFVSFRGVWIVCKISWRATCQLLLGWRLESQWYRYMWLMYFNIIAYIDWRYFFKSWNTSFFSHFFLKLQSFWEFYWHGNHVVPMMWATWYNSGKRKYWASTICFPVPSKLQMDIDAALLWEIDACIRSLRLSE